MNDEAGRRQAQERQARAAAIEAELAVACGTANMAAARQVELIARALENGSYAGAGVRSVEQWVAWQCGVSLSRARQLVRMALRLPELPATRAAFGAGELAEDQVVVVCRHVPAPNDGEAATVARSATVAQLRRTLGPYPFVDPPRPPAGPHPEPDPDPEERRRVSFGFGDDGSWRLSALLPPDEGRRWSGPWCWPARTCRTRPKAKATRGASAGPTLWWRWPSATSPPTPPPAPTPIAT